MTALSTQYRAEETAVIYSFQSRWMKEIEHGELGVFFRKSAPANAPHRVIFYVGSPISALVATARYAGARRVNLKEAIELAELGKINRSELEAYVGQDGEVKAIFVDDIQMFGRRLFGPELRQIFNFHPPQNFMRVSSEVLIKIEEASVE